MAYERTLARSESAYKNISAVAAMLTAFSPNGYEYKVENVYLDFGQNWMWTTITRESKWGGVQVLNPREWGEVTTADSPEALGKIVSAIMAGEYFNDK